MLSDILSVITNCAKNMYILNYLQKKIPIDSIFKIVTYTRGFTDGSAIFVPYRISLDIAEFWIKNGGYLSSINEIITRPKIVSKEYFSIKQKNNKTKIVLQEFRTFQFNYLM